MAEVNLDVAMQSTSEEILEKVNVSGCRQNEIYVEVSGTSGEVFSITGKGKVFGVYLTKKTIDGVNTAFSIVVDGNTIYSQSLAYTSSSSTHSFVAVSKEYCQGSGVMFFSGSTTGIGTAKITYLNLDENSRESYAGVAGGKNCAGINGYIQFNESLQIQSTGDSASTCTIIYALDEE